MKLVEVQPFKCNIIEKTKHEGVLMTLEGVLQRADTKNANKRVYPMSLWNKILKDEDVNSRLESRRMLGELDHPAHGSTALSRVSHVVTSQELRPNGEVFGRIDILDTPGGRIAETLFKAGVQLGVSSRGDGSVEQKDGFSEVQDDFRLETYDLVLKPSTPGAYPQVVESEEQAEKNLELIADAVEGLVKSTSDVEVLLECHKIISVLEGCETRRKAIHEMLTEKLKVGSEIVPEPKEEEKHMPNKAIPGGDLSPELAALIREHADAIVAERLTEKDGEINRLNKLIVDLTQSKDQTESELVAAKKLIEEFHRKVTELSEQGSTDEDLKQRYAAALKLIDEATSRLQELGDTQRRLGAAKSLIAASIDRHKDEAVNRAIDSILSDIDESVATKLRPILEDCDSPSEVEKKFKELSELVSIVTESSSSKEPLPDHRQAKPNITEDAKKKGNVVHGNFITARILDKFGVGR